MRFKLKYRLYTLSILIVLISCYFGIKKTNEKMNRVAKVQYGIVIAKTYDSEPLRLTAIITDLKGNGKYDRVEVEVPVHIYMSLRNGHRVKYHIHSVTGKKIVEQYFKESQWQRYQEKLG